LAKAGAPLIPKQRTCHKSKKYKKGQLIHARAAIKGFMLPWGRANWENKYDQGNSFVFSIGFIDLGSVKKGEAKSPTLQRLIGKERR